jgi:glyoxylase-like metal-dependent hydrolase (beta-lactamase superfamily II)
MSGEAIIPPAPTSPGGVRVERTEIAGTFSLDGGTWDVDNNVWVLGNDRECIVIDAPHRAAPILELVEGRRVLAVLLTHGHDDHIGVAVEVADKTGAPAYLHPGDRMLWQRVHDRLPGADLADGQDFRVGDVEVRVLHTPGHSPGSCCFFVPALGLLFTGDTLFQGGPGATGRSFSDFDTIVRSIRERLLVLAPETVVLTGHGAATTIGAEATHSAEWTP